MTPMARRPNESPARTLKLPSAQPKPRTAATESYVAAPERQAAFRVGISAESRAAAYLIAKGFRILARRWRSPAGEIDIVARRRNLLVFVEVKARATLEDAAYSVTDRQKQRIAGAAAIWLQANPGESERDMRFDAMLVAPGRMPVHIAAAFETT
jgi:putative endonuclease